MHVKEYPIVVARFYDHSSGPADSNSIIPCEVIGVIKEETKDYYNIVSWICNRNLSDPNSDSYCILKSTVVELIQVTGGKQYDSRNQTKYNRSKKTPKTPNQTRLRHK